MLLPYTMPFRSQLACLGFSEWFLNNVSNAAYGEHGIKPGHDCNGQRRATRREEADTTARAGERGAAPRCGVLVAGEPAGKMMYPLVRELADDGSPVTVTCRVLKIARQPYYRWLKEPVSDRERSEEPREGKGCVSTCRFRGTPLNTKKKQNKTNKT